MGNQGHATDGIRRVKEWVDAGIVGDVKEVIAWFDGPEFGEGKYFTKPAQFPPAEEPIPAGFDWDLWLGPVAPRPYNHVYHPKSWRAFYDFGNAELGDWACHTLDAPFWSLELGLPTTTELTEMSLIGVLAQRFNTRIEYDAINMKVTNHEGMERYIKEPVRVGRSYGEEVW